MIAVDPFAIAPLTGQRRLDRTAKAGPDSEGWTGQRRLGRTAKAGGCSPTPRSHRDQLFALGPSLLPVPPYV
jgi:hypothetical protein